MNAQWKPRSRSSVMLNSMVRSTYNEAGKLIREEYLDAWEQPTYNNLGVYARILEYDSQNRLIREGFLGDKGQLYSGKQNYAVIEYYYDESGNRTSKKFGARSYRWEDGYTGKGGN